MGSSLTFESSCLAFFYVETGLTSIGIFEAHKYIKIAFLTAGYRVLLDEGLNIFLLLVFGVIRLTDRLRRCVASFLFTFDHLEVVGRRRQKEDTSDDLDVVHQ